MKAFTGLGRLQLFAASLAAMLPAGTAVERADDFIPGLLPVAAPRPALSRSATKRGPGRMPHHRSASISRPRLSYPAYKAPLCGLRRIVWANVRAHFGYGAPEPLGRYTAAYAQIRAADLTAAYRAAHPKIVALWGGAPVYPGAREGAYIAAAEQIHNPRSQS